MRHFLKASAGAAALVVLLVLSLVHGGASSTSMDPVALNYFYAGAQEHKGLTATETGVAALLTVSKPAIRGTDWHSLEEMAVKDSTQNNIVEFGWSVDPGTYGDSNPHILAYHWINGNPTCYVTSTNTCGFVKYTGTSPAPAAYFPGDDVNALVSTTTTHTFQVAYTVSGWWLYFDGLPMGKFPASEWTGATPAVTTFTSVNWFQGFGEVAANSTTPCTQMGDGVLKTSPPTGSKMTNVTWSDGTTASLSSMGITNASYYNIQFAPSSVKSFYYGGNGSGAVPCP